MWVLCGLAVEKSAVIVYINGSKYYIHTVQAGETLFALAKTYNVAEQAILQSNPAAAQGLQSGTTLKIPFVGDVATMPSEKKLRKTFDTHRVAQGETLYAISRQYEIPIPTIIEDNPSLDPIRLRPGERILIRKKQIGSESEADTRAQWEEYRSSLNSVADPGDAYHIVAAGETFYSLARQFGISEQELSRLNNGLQAAELKAGAMIKVPGEKDDDEFLLDIAAEEPDTVHFEAPEKVREFEFRSLRRSEPLRIALLLPLSVEGTGVNEHYLEFYQGFLLGLDSVKLRYGYSIDLTLFNTGRNSEKVAEIVDTDAFGGSDLIVGPVYEEGLEPVLWFAEQQQIPVVSPLAHLERANSDILFQLAPDPAHKYEKAADLFNGDRRVTLIYTENTDTDFEAEMLALLGDHPYRTHTYKYEHPNDIARRGGRSAADLTSLLNNDEDNVFIVMANNEIDVDRILAAIASADTSITNRRGASPRFVVLGNARWNRYHNIDRTMFFKDRVIFLSTYHAKRDSDVVRNFDGAYIRAFNALPSLYSYRGFDTAMIFAPAMYNDIEYDMEGRRYMPLQTTYLFRQEGENRNHVNRNWTRVNYQPDFTITIE